MTWQRRFLWHLFVHCQHWGGRDLKTLYYIAIKYPAYYSKSLAVWHIINYFHCCNKNNKDTFWGPFSNYNICLLYVGPIFGNIVWNYSSFVSMTKRITNFHCFWQFFYIYLNASQYDNTLYSFTLISCFKLYFIFYIVLWYSHFT